MKFIQLCSVEKKNPEFQCQAKIIAIKTSSSITSGKYINSTGFAVCWTRAILVIAGQ